MLRRSHLALAAGVIVWLASVALTVAHAQTPASQMSEAAFKNIQVLKGIPVDEFMGTMGLFSAALSVCCAECHTGAGTSNPKWEDDPPRKRTARRMVQMVTAINRDNFNGRQIVTCWTCHRGSQSPLVTPPLDKMYGEPVIEPPDILPRATSGEPTADEIFDKYIQALGGAQRLANLTSFTAKGTYSGYDTDLAKVAIEIYAKAPAQRTTIVHAAFGDSVRVYDGRSAWIASPDKPLPLMPLTGGNLEGAKIEAIVAFPTQLKKAFSQWRVTSTAIDDREVRVLQGSNPRQPPVNFYFDDAGLLVRLVRLADTAIGRVPTQIDYSDYREVSGVKLPFRWTATWTDGQSTAELTEVQANVAIDATKFARPAPAPPPRTR